MINEIAIISAGLRFPGATSLAAFWSNQCRGLCSIRDIGGGSDASREGLKYIGRRGVLDDPLSFDGSRFGLPPIESQLMDPQHRLLLTCAAEALYSISSSARESLNHVGVFVGTSTSSYLIERLIPNWPAIQAEGAEMFARMGNEAGFPAARIAHRLDLHGPAVNVHTACSTSLVAAHYAAQAILNGECDAALAGGACLTFPLTTGYYYQEGGILSEDGHCRPFDLKATGAVPGNGAGVVLLMPLKLARDLACPVLATIKGSAVNNDGMGKMNFTSPSAEGQSAVIEDALRLARLQPRDIGYVETHGTATRLGDAIELAALSRALDVRSRSKPLKIGVLKNNIGHLDAAAGIAALIKGAMVVRSGIIPPATYFSRFNDQDGVSNEGFSLERDGSTNAEATRLIGVSAFGIGGTNAHLVLGRVPRRYSKSKTRVHLLPLSAMSADRAMKLCDDIKSVVATQTFAPADVAYSLAQEGDFRPHRCSILYDEKTGRWLQNPGCGSSPPARRKLVYLMAGIGKFDDSLVQNLYATDLHFRDYIDRWAPRAGEMTGQDYLAHFQKRSAEAREMDPFKEILRRRTASAEDQDRLGPKWAQPMNYLFQMALSHALSKRGVKPDVVLGYSVGEAGAAQLSGMWNESDALNFVCERANHMDSLPAGAMIGVGMSQHEIAGFLQDGLGIAGLLGKNATIIAGGTSEIDRLGLKLEAEGIPFFRVGVNKAFHTKSVGAISSQIRRILSKTAFAPPRLPFISCAEGRLANSEELATVGYWERQMELSINFVGALECAGGHGEQLFLEIGAGAYLAPLVRQRWGGGAAVLSLESDGLQRAREEGEPGLIDHLVGQLWQSGVSVDFEARYEDERREPVPVSRFDTNPQECFFVKNLPPATSAAHKDKAGYEAHIVAKGLTWCPQIEAAASMESSKTALIAAKPQIASRGDLVTILRDGVDRYQLCGRDASESFQALFTLAELLRWLSKRGINRILDCIALDSESLNAPPDCIGYFHHVGSTLETVEGAAKFSWTLMVAKTARVEAGDEVRPKNIAWIAGAVAAGAEYRDYRLDCLDVSTEWSVEDVPKSLHGGLGRHYALRRKVLYTRGTGGAAVENPVALKENGKYIVTGGLGKIGSVIVAHLRERYMADVAILSRSGGRDDEKDVEVKLADSQGTTSYLRCDVSDSAALSETIRKVHASWGRIDGIIHCAGIAGGSLIRSYSKVAAEEVEGVKVMGIRGLLAAAAEFHIEFVVACSSLATLTGGIAQHDYICANLMMEAEITAASPTHPARLMAICWDRWSEGGMGTAAMGRLGQGPAVPGEGISDSAGIAALEAALGSGHLHVVACRAEKIAAMVPPPPNVCSPASVNVMSGKGPSVLHEAVRRIWQDTLGGKIDDDDDFFLLGGTSLLALQILRRTNLEFKLKVGPQDFLHARSLRQYFELVAVRFESDAKKETDALKSEFGLFVPVSDSSADRAVYFIHAIGGHLLLYRDVFKGLAALAGVTAIRCAGLERDEPIGQDVRKMAENYAKAIQVSARGKTVHLVGSSFGGCLVYEIAGILQREGVKLGAIVIIDTPAPQDLPHEMTDDAWIYAYLGKQLLPEGKWDAEYFRRLPPAEMRKEFLAKISALPNPLAIEGDEQIHRMLEVYKSNIAAYRRYTPVPAKFPLHFLRAKIRRIPQDPAFPELPWIDLAMAGCRVKVIPGDHISMHYDKNAEVLVKEITTLIQGTQNES